VAAFVLLCRGRCITLLIHFICCYVLLLCNKLGLCCYCCVFISVITCLAVLHFRHCHWCFSVQCSFYILLHLPLFVCNSSTYYLQVYTGVYVYINIHVYYWSAMFSFLRQFHCVIMETLLRNNWTTCFVTNSSNSL